ncbi:MAG: LruC domain-containing protein [Planctomycetota bacterium]
MKPHLWTVATFALSLGLAPSCGTGGSGDTGAIGGADFHFETSTDVEAVIHVTLDGEPVQGVQVRVCEPLGAPVPGDAPPTGETFFTGATLASGDCEVVAKLASSLASVDLVVQLPEAAGDYTHPEWLELWGPFAPSSRITVPIDDLNGTTITLTTDRTSPPPALLAEVGEDGDLFTPVPSSVIETIGDVLPEQSSAGAAFVSESYTPNLVFSEPATVQIVFVWEGAGYRNSLGWFTYRDEDDGSVSILSSDLLIPDASFPSVGSAAIGDTYDLKSLEGAPRIFYPGEKVGFFLVADGYSSEPLIQSWDPAAVAIPSNDPETNATFGRGCYTSITKLNPEYAEGAVDLARHLAMLWLPAQPGFLGAQPHLVSGFEDLRRTGGSDDDFNDLVFIVTASPISALANTAAFVYEEGDPDLDGISGVADHFPNDGDRAFTTRLPAHGENVVGIEDLYPIVGDADFNDSVLAYHVDQVTNAAGAVTELQLTFSLVGRGAGFDHAIGLRLPGLPSDLTGLVEIERILSNDEGTVQLEDARSLAGVIASGGRVDDVFPSTYEALPPLPGMTFTNTQFGVIDRPCGSSRVLYRFDTPVPAASLGTAPYDLYMLVKHGEELWDIHFPGYSGFEDRPSHLPTETGASSFLDDNGYPWMLEVPTDWQFPVEKIRIWDAYGSFDAWVATSGASSTDWYLSPSPLAGLLSEPLLDYIPIKLWTVELPKP